MTRRIGNFLLSLTLILLAACGSLPDAKTFEDATILLSSAVRTSGQAFTDSLDEAAANAPTNAQQYEELKKEFNKAWSVRIEAANAAVDYSASVAELISSARNSGESVKRLSDSLQALATASGIPLAPAAVSTGTDIAKLLVAQIANVRASQKLEDALVAAQPAVQSIASQITSDLNTQLIPLMESVYKNNVSAIKTKYTDEENFAKAFKARLNDFRTKVSRNQADASKLVELNQIQGNVDASLKERDRELEQLSLTYTTRLRLLRSLSSATVSWADAHRDLARAIQDRRKVDVTQLQEAIATVRAITEKLEAL